VLNATHSTCMQARSWNVSTVQKCNTSSGKMLGSEVQQGVSMQLVAIMMWAMS
jgi:hypothetical protein